MRVPRRYKVKERLISDYGEGAYPQHRQVSYEIYDLKSAIGGPIRVASNMKYVEEHLHVLRRRRAYTT